MIFCVRESPESRCTHYTGILPVLLFRNSQFFANIYLNEIDQFCKRNLRAKYYLRYVDDFILLHKNPEVLNNWKNQIIVYLAEHLNLILKSTQVRSVSVYKGIDFLGYFIKSKYTLVRRRVIVNMKQKLKTQLPQKANTDELWQFNFGHLDLSKWRKVQSTLNSYLAHFHKANTYNLVNHIESKIKSYKYAIRIKNNYLRLTPKRPEEFYSFYRQLHYFLYIIETDILIVQMGKFYEFYGKEAQAFAKFLNLKPYWRNKYIKSYSIPLCRLSYVINIAKKLGLNGVLIKQSNYLFKYVKVRLPVLSWSRTKSFQLEFIKI